MLKVRITFVDDKKGKEELEDLIENIEDEMDIVSKSQIYKGRGESKFSSIYLDVQRKN